jgi:hypothetical protein
VDIIISGEMMDSPDFCEVEAPILDWRDEKKTFEVNIRERQLRDVNAIYDKLERKPMSGIRLERCHSQELQGTGTHL